MAKTTGEIVEKAQQLAMEARIRAGMMTSDYRRYNLSRLARARKYAMQLARQAADLAATAFEAADLLDAELRRLRNQAEE